eukprot:170432-Amphidinium_carterae.1
MGVGSQNAQVYDVASPRVVPQSRLKDRTRLPKLSLNMGMVLGGALSALVHDCDIFKIGMVSMWKGNVLGAPGIAERIEREGKSIL